MKASTHFRYSFVNSLKKTNIMKLKTFPKTALLFCTLLLSSLTACKEDAVAPDSFDLQPAQVVENKQIYPVTDITAIAENGRPITTLSTRGDLADIDDVPVVKTGSTIHCHGTPYQCVMMNLEHFRTRNSIKPGQRLGIYDPLSLDGYDYNNYECYRQHFNVGVIEVCGYKGKDKEHPLYIETAGNYRLQLTPRFNSRNLDLFVYKLTVRPTGKIDTSVVAMSILPAGQTETIHLTEAGFYTIVVDDKSPSVSQSDYILALSHNTAVRTIPILLSDNSLVYQFTAPSSSYKMLIGWNFKRKISGVLTDLGTYPTNSTFRFSCEMCDYYVSPVYYNTSTGLEEEGAATVIKP